MNVSGENYLFILSIFLVRVGWRLRDIISRPSSNKRESSGVCNIRACKENKAFVEGGVRLWLNGDCGASSFMVYLSI